MSGDEAMPGVAGECDDLGQRVGPEALLGSDAGMSCGAGDSARRERAVSEGREAANATCLFVAQIDGQRELAEYPQVAAGIDPASIDAGALERNDCDVDSMTLGDAAEVEPHVGAKLAQDEAGA